MPNKTAKMQNFKNTLIVFGLIILFIGCFLLAVITPFAITLHDKVASADSTDGVVEDNILSMSDFRGISSISPWEYNYPDALVYNLNYTTLLASTSQRYFVYRVPDADFLGKTLTVSYQLYGAQYVSYTFSLNNSYDGQAVGAFVGTFYDNARFRLYHYSNNTFGFTLDVGANGSDISLVWFKVEFGSSFTGYVPKDYTNYGYTQGYNDGTQDTIDTFNTIRGYKIWGATTYWFNDVLLAGYHYFDRPLSGLSDVIVRDKLKFFEYNGVAYELYNDNLNIPSGTSVNFLPNYEYSFYPMSTTGYATVPIAVNIGYVSGPLYLCSDYSFYENNVQIVVRRHDGTSTIFIDQFTVSAYYNDIPVMDLSPYLQGGFFYDFYMCSKTKGTGAGNTSTFTLQTHNTYFTGINSICLITIDNSDVLGASSYEEGRRKGYDAGRDAGYLEGYGVGYSQGELVAPAEGQYTFLGVIGALFDAPIGALSSFLNFDLLGFNMRSFFFALITLAFIILVLRIVLGSK